MKTVHEFFTNKRMEDSRFEYSRLHSWMVVFARCESGACAAECAARGGVVSEFAGGEFWMKTVHEFFTNKRMEDSRFEYSRLHSWMVVFARVEFLRARASEVRAASGGVV